ncbi:MAG: type II toxin-antitoxin system HicB family antitoxin [Rhodoplanes sp.]|jgi:antitoxin HicB
MSSITYRCRLEPDEDGGYVATFPDLPFGVTQGETASEALAEAADCLETILATLVEMGRDIPESSKIEAGEHLVSPRAITAAQVALYTAMRREKVSHEDLARRLGVPVAEVRNLTDLANYPPVETIERALAALGHRLTVALDAAE